MRTALEQYRAILDRIDAAELAAGRKNGSTQLVAVTKTFEAADILPVIGPVIASSAKIVSRKHRANGRR